MLRLPVKPGSHILRDMLNAKILKARRENGMESWHESFSIFC